MQQQAELARTERHAMKESWLLVGVLGVVVQGNTVGRNLKIFQEKSELLLHSQACVS